LPIHYVAIFYFILIRALRFFKNIMLLVFFLFSFYSFFPLFYLFVLQYFESLFSSFFSARAHTHI
jgi:hypothetical protein